MDTSKNKYSLTRTKRRIDEKMAEPTYTKRNVPNIVARLMGVDTLPSDIKPKVNSKDRRHGIGENGKVESHSTLTNSTLSKKEWKHDFLARGHRNDSYNDYKNLKLVKVPSREHPQEEELQRFKQEFVEWQASKAWENPRTNKSRQKKNYQISSQESLYREVVMAHNVDSRRIGVHRIHAEPKNHNSPGVVIETAQNIDDLGHHEYKNKERTRSKSLDFKQSPLLSFDEECGRSLSARIVILKPGPEMIDESEKFSPGSPEMGHDGSSTEEFLMKVNERLNLELKGNAKEDKFVGSGRTEVPLSEKAIDPKKVAHIIAKKVRESVIREFKMHPRQPSDSPKFRDKDEQKFSSECMRSVLRSEKLSEIPLLPDKFSLASLETKKEGLGVKTRLLEHERDKDRSFSTLEVLHRNLDRASLASESGTSPLKHKLKLLEIDNSKRNHEATKIVSRDERKANKHKVGFRGKVSNLKYRFNLRGKLFGRTLESVDEPNEDEIDLMTAFMTEPSFMRNIGCAKDNSTEVPPSPASVCMSPRRDFSGAGDHTSPVSTLDTTLAEDQPIPQVFRDINSNLYELRMKLDQLKLNILEEVAPKHDHSDLEMADFDSEAQDYIRCVLVVAGFYRGSSHVTCPIHTNVFEDVEAVYKRSRHDDDNDINRKLLFHLLNEALSTVLRPAITKSSSLKELLGPTKVPHGNKLFEHVWRLIYKYVHPTSDPCNLFDEMSAIDHGRTPWSGAMIGEIDVIGSEMESMIMREMVEELVKDMRC